MHNGLAERLFDVDLERLFDVGVFVDLHNIANQTVRSVDGRFNLEQFYSKIPYLKKVDERFSSKNSKRGNNNQRPKKEKPKKFSRTLKLSPDSALVINHKLGVKNVKVTATTTDDKPFKIEYKVKDKDNVEIQTLGEENLKFTVLEVQKEETKNFFTESAQYLSRVMMSVRSINVKWKHTTSLTVPQFIPEIGDIFGQSTHYDVMSPGLDFAFGFAGQSYIEKAMSRNWLMGDESQTTPAIYSNAKEFNAEIVLEPISGLKITLKGNRTDKRDSQIQFMFADPSILYGGSYIKTHMALATAFKGIDMNDNYKSEVFEKFLSNIPVVTQRLQEQYMGKTYPDRGFLRGTQLAGSTYNIEYGAVNPFSSDVLIPAFMAAYSGKDAKKVDLNPFPGLKSILPNWRITYDGLMRIPFFKRVFKSFNLKHNYECTYEVGSYNSYSDWVTIGDGLGFTKDAVRSGNIPYPIPTSPYNIATVNLNEKFAPVIGFDATFLNDLSLNLQYDIQRKLSLNPSAGKLVEASSKSFTVGGSYKIANFNQVLKIKAKQQNVNNDLTLNLNIKMSNNTSLIREWKISEDDSQGDFSKPTAKPQNGTRTWSVNFTANYVLSKRITLGAYFDYQANTPLVSTNSYPTTSSNYGLQINMSLVK